MVEQINFFVFIAGLVLGTEWVLGTGYWLLGTEYWVISILFVFAQSRPTLADTDLH